VQTREGEIDDKWSSLSSLSAQKKKVLEADLARETEKERLRMEFAHLAAEFVRWTKETSDNVAVSQFGFTLEEVESYQAILDKQNQEINNTAQSKKADCEKVHKQGRDMVVKENVYTKLTPDDLGKAVASLSTAMTSRNTAYKTELDRQRANDALCKQFASLAEPFVKWISEQKEVITNAKSELEAQLKHVDGRISTLATDGAKLKDIVESQKKIDAAGITNNRHTTLTSKDVEVQWDQWKSFLQKKKKMVEEAIEHNRLRGITQEQLKEIEMNFKQFDANKSNNIDKKELKACLYSLGEEKSRTEIETIMKTYGVNGAISYDGFKQFMITILGVSDTKEDILNSFVLIGKGDKVAKVDKMEMVMEDKDIQYIKETAPKAADGYDYVKWTDSIFSR